MNVTLQRKNGQDLELFVQLCPLGAEGNSSSSAGQLLFIMSLTEPNPLLFP